MSLTTWHYAEFAALIRRNLHRYFVDKDNGPIAVANLIVESNLLRDLLAAEREAGAAEVIARVADYFVLVERIHEVYRHVVMDTAEDRALHARHIETADRALSLARAALTTTEEPS